MKITLADYLILRINELGIKHVFGVPGDYNLNFLDYIMASDDLTWVGNCNELNAAYAADGYARVNGFSAIVTTAGVGELSALNGIAGSYAEDVPVIHIVGMPSTLVQQNKLICHHSFGDGDYNKFIRTQLNVTCAQEVLAIDTATLQIDQAIMQCYKEQKPIVIGIAVDLFSIEVKVPTHKLDLSLPKSKQIILEDALNIVAKKLSVVKKPLIIVDGLVTNHGLIQYVKQFISQTQIPFVSTLMAKGEVDEVLDNFLGEYLGYASDEELLANVNNSDLIIWFGRRDSDINSAWFTNSHEFNKMIRIDSDQIALFNDLPISLNGIEFTECLLKLILAAKIEVPKLPLKKVISSVNISTLNQESFWYYAHQIIKPDSTVLLELGSCAFGLYGKKLPHNVTVICQLLWASIGYSVGATLGVLVANKTPNTYLFVGDGSFQLTAQEVSTMLRHGYNPVIFLLNNNGYTVERCIHGDTQSYNDIAIWDYTKLVESFNGDIKTWKVKTIDEMKSLSNELDKYTNSLRFVEVFLSKDDVPDIMRKLFSSYSNTKKIKIEEDE